MLRYPTGDVSDDDSRACGAKESWQLGTSAGSPKPRRNNGPKGAIQSMSVHDQPMEMAEGGGDEQASKRRGEDAREDTIEAVSPRGEVTCEDGATGGRYGHYTQPSRRAYVHHAIIDNLVNFNIKMPIFTVLSRPWHSDTNSLTIKLILSRPSNESCSAINSEYYNGLERRQYGLESTHSLLDFVTLSNVELLPGPPHPPKVMMYIHRDTREWSWRKAQCNKLS